MLLLLSYTFHGFNWLYTRLKISLLIYIRSINVVSSQHLCCCSSLCYGSISWKRFKQLREGSSQIKHHFPSLNDVITFLPQLIPYAYLTHTYTYTDAHTHFQISRYHSTMDKSFRMLFTHSSSVVSFDFVWSF